MSNLRDAVGLRLAYGSKNSQFETEFEPASATVWGYFNPRGTACFSLGLLKDIRAHDNALALNGGKVHIESEQHEVRYYVWELAHYARMCIDNMYARIQNYYTPKLITISMVQGDALGGGLECALSSDVVVAEESAQMGLPEILFNLFPGMGAYSLLTRRIGMRAAEEMILSGRMLSGAEMHKAGIVDVLAKDGEAETATQEWIARNSKRQNGTQAVFRARRLVHPITRQELDSIAELWVEAAFRLQERDLKMMGRLVRSQMRRVDTEQSIELAAEALAV